jgi:hypothetical protein
VFKWVHQLDSATSGLLLVALNRDTARYFSSKFENRLVSKVYKALVVSETGTGWLDSIWDSKQANKVACEEGGSVNALLIPAGNTLPLIPNIAWHSPPKSNKSNKSNNNKGNKGDKFIPPVVAFDHFKKTNPADRLCELKWKDAKMLPGVLERFTKLAQERADASATGVPPVPPAATTPSPATDYPVGISTSVSGVTHHSTAVDVYVSCPISDVKSEFRCRVPDEYNAVIANNTEAANTTNDEPSDASLHTKYLPSLTGVNVLSKGVIDGRNVYEVEYHPYTGRRHQLRLHSNVLGGSILGDRTYGGREFRRMCLHAMRLRIDQGGGHGGARKGKVGDVWGVEQELEWEAEPGFGLREDGQVWDESKV